MLAMQRLALLCTHRSPRRELISYFIERMRLLVKLPWSVNQGSLAISMHKLCCLVYGRSTGQEGSASLAPAAHMRATLALAFSARVNSPNTDRADLVSR